MASYVRVDTAFPGHPKVLDIGPLGEALWLRGLCYAGEHLTDGFVPLTYLKRMSDMKACAVAEKLVEADLWAAADGGYQIHDYLSWQRSRDDAEQISSKRAEAGRLGGKQKASNVLASSQQDDKQTASKPASKNVAPLKEKIIGEYSEPNGSVANPPKKPLPENGLAQQIVAEFCRVAGIAEPAMYAKAVGQAGKLVKAGIGPDDIAPLYAFVLSWADSADLGLLLNQVDKWRSSLTGTKAKSILDGPEPPYDPANPGPWKAYRDALAWSRQV